MTKAVQISLIPVGLLLASFALADPMIIGVLQPRPDQAGAMHAAGVGQVVLAVS